MSTRIRISTLTGSQENKFGIALDQVRAVYERAAKMRNIEIVGVQMHIGSQITDAKPFASAIEKVAPLVSDLKSKYSIQFFSIGGGMGSIYRRALESGTGKWWRDHGPACAGSAFSVRDYAEAIAPPLRDLGIWTLVEPGRFLIGNAGVLLTRVRYIKQTGSKKFAIVDAGMNDAYPAGAIPELSRDRACRASAAADADPSTSMSTSKSLERIDICRTGVVGRFFCARPRDAGKSAEGAAIMSAGRVP